MNVLATCAFSCTACLRLQEDAHQEGRRHRSDAGYDLPDRCDDPVELSPHPHLSGDPRDAIVAMLPTVFLPFNVVKGGLNMALILVLYKPVVTALRKARLVPESQTILQNKGKVNAGVPAFLHRAAGYLRDHRAGADGHSVNHFSVHNRPGRRAASPRFCFLNRAGSPCCPCGIPCQGLPLFNNEQMCYDRERKEARHGPCNSAL